MSIVKMKHLRLIGLKDRREDLLRALQHLGSVQITLPDAEDAEEWAKLVPAQSGDLDRARQDRAALDKAIQALKTAVPEKGGLLEPLPQVSEKELFDDGAYAAALAQAGEIGGALDRANAIRAELPKLAAQRAALAPWLGLDVPLETSSTKDVTVAFASVLPTADWSAVTAAVEGASELAQLTQAGRDRDGQYFLLVCHSSAQEAVLEALKPFGYAAAPLRGWTGTAGENDARLAGEEDKLRRELDALTAQVEGAAAHRRELKLAADRAAQEIGKGEDREKLLQTEKTYFLEGWFPAEDQKKVEEVLKACPCAYEVSDPTEEEYPQVPIKLKNNPVTAPFSVITEMYSMPAYGSVDPNPLMAPFFILFFGFMMNDIGYGLLMAIGTAVYLKLKRPKGNTRNMMSMFFMCGISSIFWGCLTGSFFGDFLPKLFALTGVADDFVWFWPPLFTPINDIIMVMIGAMVLGVIQVFTGMAVSVVEKFRHGHVLDAVTQEIAWWCILLGAAAAICGNVAAGSPAALGTVGIAVLVLGAALLPVGSIIRSKSPLGAVTWLWDAYQSISGYFSDILSYLRLMALMMAGSIIASVFNTLGSVFGLVPFLIVALIGNVLNLVLNLLGCYVHTMRLQCLEFFGRFYQDGGKPFRPLAVETKYVDILKEEM